MLDTKTFDPRELRNAFGRFATGVTVVTMLSDQGVPTGVTVSSFSSLSLEPALCLFSLGKTQASCRWIAECKRFVINVLSEDQEGTAWQFARPAEDKMAGVSTRMGVLGIPVIEGSLCRFECRLWNTYDGGDHIIVVGEIVDFAYDEGNPMLFYKGKMISGLS